MIAHLDAFDRHYPHLFVYLRERDEIKRGFRERVKLSPKQYERFWQQIVREGVKNGEFRPDLDVQVVSYGILGMLNWLYKWYRPQGRLSVREVAEQLTALAGVTVPAPKRNLTRRSGESMKISAFHLMPHRELPADFEKRYESVWVTPPWWELADARRVGQYYNWTLDELLYAAKCGFDGVCTNEHHQNAYGFMPNPNIMGSVLAKLTNDTNVAIVQMGATLPTSNPPIRVAEEYAMLDCLSGGRLVAGLPLGSPMDVNLCYGITPMEHRERYREAFALTLKAWQARELFAWNGRYYQLANVNLWPRPIQQPHPPVWVPGSGSISTFDFAVEHEVCYCFLSYSGAKAARSMMDKYWTVVTDKGREPNPYRAGFLQLVTVADTDAQAEDKYARHVEYFYHKCLHWPVQYLSPPGNQDYRSLVASVSNPLRRTEDLKQLRYRDFVEKGYVISGSPATVRDRLMEEVVKGLHVGNLMVLLQIGSMPHELTLENVELFARKVLPDLRDVWNDEGWVNHWWPERLRGAAARPPAAGVGASRA